MINVVERAFPSQFYTNAEYGEDIEQNTINFFEQDFLVLTDQRYSKLIHIVHAPYSQPHAIRITDERQKEVLPLLNTKGTPIHIPDTNNAVGIPRTQVLCSEYLRGVILRNCEALGLQLNLGSRPIQEYGDFQPEQIFRGIEREGVGLDTRLFLLAFLSSLAREKNAHKLKNDIHVVIHTDIPYFLTAGRHEDLDSTMDYLDKCAALFNVRILIENSKKPKSSVFEEAIPWGFDPEEIARTIEGRNRLGVCVDIAHCISNELSLDEIERKVRKIKSLGIPIVIHSRDEYVGNSEMQSLSNYSFQNAIPIAYEQ